MSAFTDVLANIIRTVDGQHDLGAGELAERIEVELAKAGIAITQLPEPDGKGAWAIEGTDLEVKVKRARSTQPSDPGLSVLFNSPNRPSRIEKSYDMSVGPDLAAALLAAAASIPTKETPNA